MKWKSLIKGNPLSRTIPFIKKGDPLQRKIYSLCLTPHLPPPSTTSFRDLEVDSLQTRRLKSKPCVSLPGIPSKVIASATPCPARPIVLIVCHIQQCIVYDGLHHNDNEANRVLDKHCYLKSQSRVTIQASTFWSTQVGS